MNNDPFKKMDLNFDPTVEAKVEPKKEEVSSQQAQQNTTSFRDDAQTEAKKVQAEQIAANEFALRQQQAQVNAAKQAEQPKQMDETLEFVIQDDDITEDTKVEVSDDAKQAKKTAYKFRMNSFFWIGIAVLAILFGATSIWHFAQNTIDFIHVVNVKEDEKVNVGKAITTFIFMFGSSFEAFLFAFFIFFSIKKYRENHKPYAQWWSDTEPIRIALALRKEVEVNNKNRERANSLGVPYIPAIYSGTTGKEELEHYKKENKTLSELIKKELINRKQQSK